MKLQLLLTNDDGIDAEGLATLAEAVAGFGELLIVAPLDHMSSCSHQVSTEKVRLEKRGANRYAVGGFPADCVRVAIQYLDFKPDWVLSGINHGGNLGVDSFFSGTVAAVREGACYGIKGIAFSHYRARGRDFDWPRTIPWVRRCWEDLQSLPLMQGNFWSINFPHLLPEEAEPPLVHCRTDRQPMNFYWEAADDGLLYRGDYQGRQRTPGSDLEACFGGKVAISLQTV